MNRKELEAMAAEYNKLNSSDTWLKDGKNGFIAGYLSAREDALKIVLTDPIPISPASVEFKILNDLYTRIKALGE